MLALLTWRSFRHVPASRGQENRAYDSHDLFPTVSAEPYRKAMIANYFVVIFFSLPPLLVTLAS